MPVEQPRCRGGDEEHAVEAPVGWIGREDIHIDRRCRSAEVVEDLDLAVLRDSLAVLPQLQATLRDTAEPGLQMLLQEIGEGGFGVVYEARRTKTGNRVALKTLPTGIDGQYPRHQGYLRQVWQAPDN